MSGWRAAGSYFEVCNCDAPCSCRRIGGRPGSAYQFETCDFVLSWRIDEGHFGDMPLRKLNAALAGRWDDAEPPWHVVLYVDEQATPEQQRALESIFLGRAGGTVAQNYGGAIGEVHSVKPACFEFDHTRGREWLRIGQLIDAAVDHTLAMSETVSCGIPGHDHPGHELVATRMRVADGPLQWFVEGRCGFEAEFDYRSD